jgi:ADP-heptose:LPS heptosyltransferase
MARRLAAGLLAGPEPRSGAPLPRKILVIQFKYLGDAVVATPTLRALKQWSPECELHVLVPAEAAPLLGACPAVDRVWAFRRVRGSADLRGALPLLGELRRERFDLSIDLAGNDRGALVSAAVGARRRVGAVPFDGAHWRTWCYTDPVEDFDANRHETLRLWAIAAPLGVPLPDPFAMEITPDPAYRTQALDYLRGAQVLCQVTASQARREWPAQHWIEFHQRAQDEGLRLAFTGGNTPRERGLLEQLAAADASLPILPPAEPLPLLLAVLAQVKVFVGVDGGPLHFAAAVGTPTISLFGPTSSQRWAPVGARHHSLQGGLCPCSGHADRCASAAPCMDAIRPADVLEAYRGLIRRQGLAGPTGPA